MPPPLLVLSLVALLPLALSLAPNSPSFLIVQNSGGGHGSIGYHLAKRLAKVGPVTFLQDSACDKSKEPFASYNNLEIDVDIQYLDFKTDLPSLPQFDVVIDNFSKVSSWKEREKKGGRRRVWKRKDGGGVADEREGEGNQRESRREAFFHLPSLPPPAPPSSLLLFLPGLPLPFFFSLCLLSCR